ncbi:MAG: hypothetical protein VX672_08730, partial [Planctomycetota bacterium]|nr:hypothetical protein [Planctomycetota bacterium]
MKKLTNFVPVASGFVQVTDVVVVQKIWLYRTEVEFEEDCQKAPASTMFATETDVELKVVEKLDMSWL